MSERRSELLHSFKQQHILEYYEQLNEQQKDSLIDQLGYIHFDIIDLVNQLSLNSPSTIFPSLNLKFKYSFFQHFNSLVRYGKPQNYGGYSNVPASKVVDFKLTDKEILKQYSRIGLETISKGKMAVLLNFSGVCQNLGLPVPKALYDGVFPGYMCQLEYYINKIRAIGEQAQKKVGKLSSLTRLPILILIQTNEKNHEMIDNYLISMKYFNYPGIIAFSTVREQKFIGNYEKS